MSIYSSKRKSRRSSKSHLGHLKLSVIEESSALVIHIFEARGLQRKDNGSLDTYVKIYLLPDPHKVTKEKTRIVRQKDPTFNEKFSLILGENDQDKQLFISVWTRNAASRNEMIGCMTFMVSELLGPNKGLNGWYQVLDESRGRIESQQVPTSILKYEASLSKYESSALRGQKTFAVTIMKGHKGYGFSVFGHRPVHITQVTPGLPAYNADLRVGDVILEVQGTDTRRANGTKVVEIIRKSPNTIQMILQRDLANPQHFLHSRHAQQYTNPSNQFNSLSRIRSKSFMSIANNRSSNADGEGVLPSALGAIGEDRRRHSTQYGSQSQLAPEFHQNPYLSTMSSAPPHHQVGTFLQPPLINRGMSPTVLSQPTDLYGVQEDGSADTSTAYNFSHTQGDQDFGSGLYPAGMGTGQMSYGTTVVHTSSRRKVSRNKTVSGGENPAISKNTNGPLAMSQPTEDFYGRGGGSLRYPVPPYPQGRGTGNHHLKKKSLLTQHDVEEEEDGHGVLTRTASLMPRPSGSGGIRSGRKAPLPPRHTSNSQGLSSAQKITGEQGVPSVSITSEEAAPVDWESLTLQEQDRQKAAHNLVTAELSLCEDLKVGMETYIQPLESILPESAHKRMFLAIPELYSFSSEISEQLKSRRVPFTSQVSAASHYFQNVADAYVPKFKDLLIWLKMYTQNYQQARQEIALSFTNEAFTKLVQEAVEKNGKPSIYLCMEAAKEYLQKLSKWMMALLYLTPLYHSDQKHLDAIVEALIPLTTAKELVEKWESDREKMRNKQLCVGFGPKVPSFPLMVPGRFLLHEGEIVVIEKRKKKKIWLMLFSDILLLTRRNGKIFTCIEEAILLDNLTITNVNCTEPTDFQLVVVEGTFSRLMRAGNVAAREEWVEKLKEKATGSMANRKRAGDKSRSHPLLQEALRKQSHMLMSTLAVDHDVEVTAHKPMASIPESATSTAFDSKRETSTEKALPGAARSDADGSSSPLKRGVSKRRSL